MSAHATASEPSRQELGNRIRSGLGWKLLSEGLRLLSRTGVAVILARTLGPHDFGVAGMALIISSFVIAFADLGLGGAIVQVETVTERGLATVFWASVAGGTVFSVLGIVAAPWIATFFHEPRVEPLVMVLSLSFVITSLGSTHRSLLARAMDFRSLELRFLAGALAGAVAGVAAAIAGFGPWALIVQEIVLASVSTILLWHLMSWRPRWAFSMHDLRSLGGFGLRSVGGSLFGTLNQNVDNLLVGRFIGASALGIYSLAYSAILMPLTRIVTPVQQVLFPAFSRLQADRSAMGDAWLRTLRTIAAIVMPMMFGLMACAPDLIPLVFGHKWVSAVPVIQVLALASIVQCLVTMNSTVLLALGSARLYLWISVLMFLVNLVAFIIGLKWGVLGVASAYTISSTVLGIGYTVATARRLELPTVRVPRALTGVSAATGAMVAVILSTRMVLGPSASDAQQVAVCAAAGGLAYGAMIYWCERGIVDDLRSMLRRRGVAPDPVASV